MKENRGILARLMAIENITVEHRHASTASFDVFNRILTLPTWKDMSAELYDLLRAHEVGHALETPAAGWHDAVLTDKRLRSFLNVVEDARIEKLIKNRYPGLRPSFVRGYRELYEQDFFGAKDKDLDTLLLVDRINLHFKIGSYLNVPFSSDELKIVRAVEQVQTWDDVVQLAKTIFDFDQEEFEKQIQSSLDEFDYRSSSEADDGYGEYCDSPDSDYFDDAEDSHEDSEQPETNSKESQSRKVGNKGRGVSYHKKYQKPLDDWYEFNSEENNAPESMTDRIFRMREKDLLDSNSIPFLYMDLPRANLDQIIVSHKTVTSQFKILSEVYPINEIYSGIGYAEYKTEFMIKNKRYVDHLVRDFELKRNARQLARAGQSKTGALNLNKVYKYKLTDDIFQRMTVVPKGKNHGMIMVFDQSGSMGEHYAETLEQIMVLAMFCRKINVPYHVYGFTDNQAHLSRRNFEISQKNGPKFTMAPNEIALFINNTFALREYFSHTQTSTEFKAMLDKVMYMAAVWRNRRNWSVSTLPLSERLHGTPLNEAIAALITLVPEFKKAHRLDVVNTIILTDGQGNSVNRVCTKDTTANNLKTSGGVSRYSGATRIRIRDQRTKLESESLFNSNTTDNSVTVALLKLFRLVTGSRSVGYFIGENHRNYLKDWYLQHDYGYNGTMDSILEHASAIIRKQGFIKIEDSEKTGYDAYYRINKKMMNTENETLEVSSNAKVSEIRKAFINVNGDKRKHRVLLSNFIESIA